MRRGEDDDHRYDSGDEEGRHGGSEYRADRPAATGHIGAECGCEENIKWARRAQLQGVPYPDDDQAPASEDDGQKPFDLHRHQA
ncbi:MAG: hypothetical protein HW422_1532 [Cutibacterium acnes]|nr:hypothetical protein [Cutibacterium acnes]